MDLEKIRVALENERWKLFEELHAWEDHQCRRVGEYHDNIEHKVDHRLELERQILSNKQTQAQLMEVERALRKLYSGTYGLCESCGEPIPPARLEVLPHATLCINCKTKEEKS